MNKDQNGTALAVRSISAAQSADPRGGKVAPLSGHWRHGNGVVSCGTLRIFSENFDTQPADAVKTEIVQWVCDTLNAARERAQGRRFASRAIPHRPKGRRFPRELMKRRFRALHSSAEALPNDPRAMGEN